MKPDSHSAAAEAIGVLRANGVDRVFGNPGTTELPLLDATVAADLPFHTCLHECVATGMADGYGRATGTVGVAMVHTSVGTANTMVNLINARADRSALLVIAGEKDLRLSGRGSFGEVPDLASLTRQVTKESWRAALPEKVPELTYRALKVARAPMPGPVFLSVPECCSAADVPPQVQGAFAFPAPVIRTRPHPQDLRDVMDALIAAQRPLIIAGNEIGAQRASAKLARMAQRLCVPVITEEAFAVTGINFPNNHPMYHGTFKADLEVLRDADLVVALGSRAFLEYTFPSEPTIRPGVRFIQVGADIGEFGKIYPVELTVLCAADLALDEMCALAEQGLVPDPQALAQRRARAEHGEERVAPRAPRVAPPASARQMPRLADLIDALHEVLPADGVIVDQSVLSKGPLHRRFPLCGDRLYFGTSGGGLGWGVGAAMGIQLGLPARRVAAFLGDGATLYSIQGLWTAANMKLPVVFIVVNNGGYMAVRKGLGEFGGVSVERGVFPGCWIAEPAVDFCSLARGFGVKAAAVNQRDQLVDALRMAFDAAGPMLLEVSVHPDDYF